MITRPQILSRTLAALLGGYALAHALPIMLVSLLALPRMDAVMAAGQLAFPILAVAMCWAFAARSALAAWVGLVTPAAAAGLIGWVLL